MPLRAQLDPHGGRRRAIRRPRSPSLDLAEFEPPKWSPRHGNGRRGRRSRGSPENVSMVAFQCKSTAWGKTLAPTRTAQENASTRPTRPTRRPPARDPEAAPAIAGQNWGLQGGRGSGKLRGQLRGQLAQRRRQQKLSYERKGRSSSPCAAEGPPTRRDRRATACSQSLVARARAGVRGACAAA